MLQFQNNTGFEGTLFATPDEQGVDSIYAVVKGTFDLERGLAPAEQQVPVALADEYYGEPGASSIRVPSDVGLEKPGTDVLLVGHAYPPGGRPAVYVDVWLTVGPIRKVVRVFGDRQWRSDGIGYVLTSPEPFEAMPLVWERAYGGAALDAAEPQEEPRNPVGTGFRAPGSDTPVEEIRPPNLENPYAPITGWKDRPPPACFAPICAHWEPRRSYAGTYDEAWQQQRAPSLPADFDPRFFQLAPPDQVWPGHLAGGEQVEIVGASPAGPLSFRLPAVGVRVTYVVDGSREVRPAKLDTVLIEPDAGRVVLVWRSRLACDKKVLRVESVIADLVAAQG